MTDPGPRCLYFDGYRIDAVARQLRGPDDVILPITGKAFDVLVYLVEHRDRAVDKGELLDQVWAGRIVEENTLTQAVSALRRALGVAAGDHRHIVTIPGRGYRFVSELQAVEAAGAAEGASAGAPAGMSRPAGGLPLPLPWTHGRPRWALSLVLLAALALLATTALRQRAPSHQGPARASTPPTTLAVLPFRALGAGERDTMLGLGMAETLISRLSGATTLRVLSLGSVQGFVGKDTDPLRTGMALGADYVVEGSTQRRGTSVRINARLLSLPDGRTVWAGTFDETLDRAFTLQDALAESVSTALSHQYATRGHASPCDGADAQAYRAYLRGRYLVNRSDPQRLRDAVIAFHEAIALDPRCARAWAGSAFARRALVMVADHDPRREFPLSYAEIEQALAIDPNSAEAHVAKGFNQFWYDWDWAGSEATLRHALALNPNLVDAHYALAHLFNNLGRHEQALLHARQAMQLDPLSPLINVLAAGFIGNAGQLQEARQRMDRVVALEPHFWIARLFRGGMALGRGDHAQGMADIELAVELSGRNSQSVSRLAMLHAQSGRRDQALSLLRELEQRDYVPATRLAAVHLSLGDRQRALDLLELGYRQRDIGMSFLKEWFMPLRDEPRFQALLRRMQLPSAPVQPAAARKGG